MSDEDDIFAGFDALSDQNILLQLVMSFVTQTLKQPQQLEEKGLKFLKLCLKTISEAQSSIAHVSGDNSHNLGDGISQDVLVSRVLNEICISRLFRGREEISFSDESNESKTWELLLVDVMIVCLEILGQRCFDETMLLDLLEGINKSICRYITDCNQVGEISEANTTEVMELLRVFGGLLQFLPALTPTGEPRFDKILNKVVSYVVRTNYKIASSVMIHLFPTLIRSPHSFVQQRTVHNIWNQVAFISPLGWYDVRCDEQDSNTGVLLLCSLSNILHGNDLWFKYSYHKDEKFWFAIQFGLVHGNSLCRKRALYIFKHFLNSVELEKIDVVGPFKDSAPMFFWKVKQLSEVKLVWEDIAILFEVFEEKQVHVIKPVLHKLDRIIKISTKSGSTESINLHTSWVVHLFCRLLLHESKTIVHWTVLRMLQLNFHECPILEQKTCEMFLRALIKALNDSSLYARTEQNKGAANVAEKNLVDFLKQCVDTLAVQSKQGCFLKTVLCFMSSEKWSGVALLYLSSALSKIGSCPSWSKENLQCIRTVVAHSQETQEPLLRGAIQCYLLKTIINLVNVDESFTFNEISGLLNVFARDESLMRHTLLWSDVSLWLSSVIASRNLDAGNSESAFAFCTNNIKRILDSPEKIADDDIRRLARVIVLLADASVIRPETACTQSQCLSWTSLLAQVTYNLLTAHTRPYLSNEKFQRSLRLYTHLLEESKGCQKESEDLPAIEIAECLEDPEDMFKFIFCNIFAPLKNMDDLDQLKVNTDALYVLSGEKQFHSVLMCLCGFFVEECSKVTEMDSSEGLLLELWTALAWLCHFLFDSSVNSQNFSTVQESLKNILLSMIEQKLLIRPFPKPGFIRDNISTAEWSRLTNKAVMDSWFCAKTVVPYCTQPGHTSLFTQLAHQALETLCTGPRCAVSAVFDCMKLILPQIIDCDMPLVLDIVSMGWKSRLELHRSDLYRPSLRAFASMVFQPSFMESSFANVANEYVAEFKEIGESSSGIFNIVVDQCCSRDFMNAKFDLVKLMADSLTFGPLHRKDQRILEDAMSFVIEQGSELAVNQLLSCDHKSDTSVRVKAVNFILSMKPENPEDQHFAKSLVTALVETDEKLSQSQSVYYGNSLTHRIKNRIWQAVLLLLPFLSEGDKESLLIRTYDCLAISNQQTSVRYLEEWVVFQIIYSCPALSDTMKIFAKKAAGNRPGIITSILSVLVFFSHHVNDLESLADDWLPNIISYCMTQNFNIRIYAHVALRKLWSLCESRKLDAILEKYALVSTCLQSFASAANSGNAEKNRQKLVEDFYFKIFDPVKDFTLQTLFYELPRLSNVTHEEWIQSSVFQSHSTSSFITVQNHDTRLQDCVPSGWSTRSAMDADPNEDMKGTVNFQKKITPWTQMISETDITLKKKHIPDGLVVVASLIDKSPNLGGLCRTSEVFGVSQFVIGNMSYLDDKQFQNLAVTADKWIPIREVKPFHLKDYLLSLKKKGYTLIGAEQTDDSEPLMKCIFPKKSVILLGNEKEGLPVDLIQVLDMCVQIPQHGIIRSLNVHVSGAILIWEYARQHIFCETS